MPSTILSDNGASSGTAGIKTTGSNDGQLVLQTTTAGGAATTAVTIDTAQNTTLAGTLTHPLGSAGSPSITFTGDTNTGLYSSGADTVVVVTGGTAAQTIDSGQRTKFPTTIGVGGATPSTSGSGISFPATQSASSDANTLDDYEEGTFTPTIAGGFSSGPTSYTQQNGKYVKIGRVVYFAIGVDANGATANASSLRIGGLPFTSAAAPNGFSGAYVNYQISFNTNTGDNYHIPDNSTLIIIYDNAGNERLGNAAGVNINNLVAFTGFYFV